MGRRLLIVANIGLMKMDGRSGRNPLKGALGDALHAVLCEAQPQHSPAAQEASASFYPNLAEILSAVVGDSSGIATHASVKTGLCSGGYS